MFILASDVYMENWQKSADDLRNPFYLSCTIKYYDVRYAFCMVILRVKILPRDY
jgi:hypothetical protein